MNSATNILFSIITPSFNLRNYIEQCCNSISDQNVEFEHIVVDGLSIDGTQEWLKDRSGIRIITEKDKGMYEAINKGIKISNGEIISYLNCDEQYLPGALNKVKEFFLLNPKVDILFGNTLITDPSGNLLAYRKGFPPRWPYIWSSYLYLQTSSMFFRRNIIDSGIFFNDNWKTIGDSDFVVRVLRSGFKAKHIDQYFSTFTLTGTNYGASQLAMDEIESFRRKAPFWIRYSKLIFNFLIRFEKFAHFAYWEKAPISYSIFTLENAANRTMFTSYSHSPLYPRLTT